MANQLEIDTLLEDQLIGVNYERDLSTNYEGLTEKHPFCWERIMMNPKSNHGVYESRGNWYKTMKYEVLHSGGFLRLFTLRGRIYWNAQNESEHTTPDWKFHFSCDLEHIGAAWNSLTALFMDMKCEIGMKVTVHDYDSALWSEGQRGREITVYVYRYHTSYQDYMQGAVPEHDHDVYLGPELHEIYNTPFWFSFLTTAEARLRAIGAVSRGVADGDLGLPGCTYASLRNEAFISVPKSIAYPKALHEGNTGSVIRDKQDDINGGDDRGAEDIGTIERSEVSDATSQQRDISDSQVRIKNNEGSSMSSSSERSVEAPVESSVVLAYPPNNTGWNAAKHPNPMLELIFFLRAFEKLQTEKETVVDGGGAAVPVPKGGSP